MDNHVNSNYGHQNFKIQITNYFVRNVLLTLTLQIVFCLELCNSEKVVINKCCDYGQILNSNFVCVSSNYYPPNLTNFPSSVISIKGKPNDSRKYSRLQIHRPRGCEKLSHTYINQNPINISKDGQLIVAEEGYLNFIREENFCVDRTIYENYVVEMCKLECSKNSPCIRKCCLPNEIIDTQNQNSECFPVLDDEQKWSPILYEFNAKNSSKNSEYEPLTIPTQIPESRLKKSIMRVGNPKCVNNTFDVISFSDNRFYLLSSGDLVVESPSGEFIGFTQDKFCIDGIEHDEDFSSRIETSLMSIINEKALTFPPEFKAKVLSEWNQYVFVCFPDATEDEEYYDAAESDVLADQFVVAILPWNWRFYVLPVTKLISSFFLLLTAVIYLILWKDHGLPGRLQFSYTVSLFIAFSCLSVVQFWTQEIYNFSIHLCRAFGYIILASFLSVFFWLTCMNIDLWCSFRTCPMKTNLGKRKGKRKFFCFALICLGIPASIVATAITIDMEHRNDPSVHSVIPASKIGVDTCTLSLYDKISQLYYFYFPVGILLVINVIFFFCTMACLRERQRETKLANSSSTAADYDRERFQLFARLFLVMGVLWIFELISWILEFLEVDPAIRHIFLFTDLLNSLQGVAVFFLFVWKPHTRRQLKQKFLRIFWKQGIFKRNSTQKSTTLY